MKYNQNLCGYAAIRVKTSLRTLFFALLYVSLGLLMAARLIMLISSIVTIHHYSAEVINRPLIQTVIVRSAVVLALAAASVVLTVFRKKMPFMAAGCAGAVVAAGIHFFDYGTFEKIQVIAILIPAVLVILTALLSLIFAKRVADKIHKNYLELSARLYRAAISESADGTISSADLEQRMNDYHGEEIRIKPKKKDR